MVSETVTLPKVGQVTSNQGIESSFRITWKFSFNNPMSKHFPETQVTQMVCQILSFFIKKMIFCFHFLLGEHHFVAKKNRNLSMGCAVKHIGLVVPGLTKELMSDIHKLVKKEQYVLPSLLSNRRMPME